MNTPELRSKFLEEGDEPQTPAEGSQVIEIENKANDEKAKVQEVTPNGIIPFGCEVAIYLANNQLGIAASV